MKLLASLLCASLLCMYTKAAAQNSSPHDDRPPVLRCGKVKFVSEKGRPVALQAIGVMWIEIDWNHLPASVEESLHLPIKARKELKTNDQGEISIPGVKGGPYVLGFLVLGGDYPEGHFQSSEKPESCLQVLEIQGKRVLAKS